MASGACVAEKIVGELLFSLGIHISLFSLSYYFIGLKVLGKQMPIVYSCWGRFYFIRHHKVTQRKGGRQLVPAAGPGGKAGRLFSQ